ncbi:ABC transporter ATP-binding protein [Acuticoccus sediminis]|uniref:ABC transporter ATP-binding protein n=1 Tax=Acuticoccus sediminis TaxID=2184697 RepID=A0A8B2NSK4_9HYPH|nr:ABC transporter ATP-binding protein [Acuticoccus sediminis]RAH98362.1 ABC transporter ATP-binding protein [Acuticoccus sediminis]
MLELDNLVKSFGGVVATDHVSLSFAEQSLTAIIGPNGAGKTTLFNLITGHLAPTSGRILLDGENIAGQSPASIVARGIGRAFQIASIFPTLTVEQQLIAAVAAHQKSNERMLSAFPPLPAKQRAEELIAQLALGSVARRRSSTISHGDQKVLDVGLALALEPKVLLLDEPTAGMGPDERWAMMETVQRLWKTNGMTLIFIEHDIDIVFSIAQRINVLSYGAVLASGTPEEIKGHPKVIEAYLGSEDAGAAA